MISIKNTEIFTIFVQGRSPLTLQKSSTIKAEVIESFIDGTIKLKIGGRVVTGRTEIPLQAGQHLLLKVEGTQDEIRLRVLTHSKASSTMKNVLLNYLRGFKNDQPLQKSILILRDLIDKLPSERLKNFPSLLGIKSFFRNNKMITPSDLKDKLLKSGVIFEAELRSIIKEKSLKQPPEELLDKDLKGLLLRLKEELKEETLKTFLYDHRINTDELAHAVERLLQGIQKYQILSKLDNALYFFVPFIWKDLKDGQIVFRHSQGRMSEQDRFDCVIKLDIERIGKIWSHIVYHSETFFLNIYCNNQIFCEMLAGEERLIESQFSEAGLSFGGMRVRFKEDLDLNKPLEERVDIKA